MKRKRIAVIGLGDFGVELVKRLYEEGQEVTAVDQDHSKVEKIKEYCTYAVAIDSTDEAELSEHGIDEMDAVVLAIGDNFENLIVTADVLKKIKVENIYARYQSDLNKRVLQMLGITNLFNPEEEAAHSMAQQLIYRGVKGVTSLGDEYRILEIVLPKHMLGKTLSECKIREDWNLNLITVKRPKKNRKDSGSEEILGILQPHMILKENDILVLFGLNEDLEKLLHKR
ncbi:NADP oxidoreductase coenzyme F420-dependent [Leptospira fainei serovar Hurstbridge str. BUT 6]|uniref:NADP oxidoreductase coenzyme F420-dependent n=1 Tax=Leptospira fainei serovar Hurstbridge str. BUT 6 TaxID=1193011 RepID=S3UUW4_9LEPT|nr:TrkA family potassium uptake protein [Leptospira fainei]EPG73013.1 NADP oxidoreductase coenzyme F420-dependent [Leptospira fainei serovar Hurstbridge str. BUT 6]